MNKRKKYICIWIKELWLEEDLASELVQTFKSPIHGLAVLWEWRIIPARVFGRWVGGRSLDHCGGAVRGSCPEGMGYGNPEAGPVTLLVSWLAVSFFCPCFAVATLSIHQMADAVLDCEPPTPWAKDQPHSFVSSLFQLIVMVTKTWQAQKNLATCSIH